MSEWNDRLLVSSWIKLHKEYRKGGDRSKYEWANRALGDVCKSDPTRGLNLIFAICEQDSSDSILELLSAGPLENLLYRDGEHLLPLIEKKALHDKTFRKLLGGVWTDDLPSEVRSKIDSLVSGKW